MLDLWHDVLARLMPGRHIDALLGDLTEEYRLRSRTGAVAAGLWYGSQLVRSVGAVLVITISRSDWKVFTVAGGLYVIGQLIAAAVMFALSDRGSVAVGLLTSFGVGFIGARHRRESSLVLAMMIFVTVFALMWLAPGSAPPWYIIAGPGAIVIGGAFASKRS